MKMEIVSGLNQPVVLSEIKTDNFQPKELPSAEFKDGVVPSSDLPSPGSKDCVVSPSDLPSTGSKDCVVSSSDLPSPGSKDCVVSPSDLSSTESKDCVVSSSDLPSPGSKDCVVPPSDLQSTESKDCVVSSSDLPSTESKDCAVSPSDLPSTESKDYVVSSSDLPLPGSTNCVVSPSDLPSTESKDCVVSSSDLPSAGSKDGVVSSSDLPSTGSKDSDVLHSKLPSTKTEVSDVTQSKLVLFEAADAELKLKQSQSDGGSLDEDQSNSEESANLSSKVYNETNNFQCKPSSQAKNSSQNLYPSLSEYLMDSSSSELPTTVTDSVASSQKIYPEVKNIQHQQEGNDTSKITFRGRGAKSSLKEKTESDKSFKIPEPKRSLSSSINKKMTQENYEVKQHNLSKKFCYCFAVLLLLSCVYGIYYLFSSTSIHSSSLSNFSDHIKAMRQSFPSQSENLWKTVRASSNSILQEGHSKRPAVILMASSTSHASLALCIAKHITSGFESARGLSPNILITDIDPLKHVGAAQQKLHLDDSLNAAFSTHKRKSFIIENLQLLDPEAALIFYKYCDGDHAPFKDVMILLTLYFDEKKCKIESSKTVENCLESLWKRSLDMDKVNPIMSRIANHIIMVSAENELVFANACSSD